MAAQTKALGPKATVRDILEELLDRTNNDMRRIRILEQKAESAVQRINAAESAVLDQRKDLNASISELGKKVSEIEDSLGKIENTMKEVVAQLKRVASASKIKELEELVEIYNPLKSNFITREEVERLLEEREK